MTWTNFWYSIADIFEFCFKIIKKLGQGPNALAWVLLAFLLALWTLQLRKQVKEARQNGTHE